MVEAMSVIITHTKHINCFLPQLDRIINDNGKTKNDT